MVTVEDDAVWCDAVLVRNVQGGLETGRDVFDHAGEVARLDLVVDPGDRDREQ